MSKIGDLFIKLGLKKQDFDKGIDEAEKQVKGFSVSTKAMATAAAAAWAAVAAAVVKFAKDAVKMTQTWGDQWNVTMAGVKGAYSAFVRQLASGEGFDNLFSNMREAARVARETAKALDELFERNVSYSYEEAEGKKYIEQQRTIMNDASKSDAEREQAANNIIKKEEELGKVRWDIAKQRRDALSLEFEAQTGLNRAQQLYMTQQYNQNRDVINQAREYNDELKKREKAYNTIANTANATPQMIANAKAAVDELKNNTESSVKSVANLVKGYDKSSDELVKGLVDADVALINVETDTIRAQQRATRLLGTLEAKDNGGGGGGGGKSEAEIAAEQAAAVAQRVAQAAKSEEQILAEKYVEELKLLKQYGYDTEELTRQYMEEAVGITNAELDQMLADIEGLEPVVIEPIEIDDSTDAALEKFKKHFEELKRITEEFGDAVAGGFTDACEEMLGQLMGLQQFNPGAAVKTLLEPLADMAEKAGAIIMAEGFATLAAKSALETFGATGWGAVAAGAALIAAGAAAKAGLAALAKGGSSGASATTYGGSGGGGTTTQDIQTELTITVEGRISGGDIVLAGQKTLNSWNR